METEYTPKKMTKQQAMELLCQKIGEVYKNDFPCICGENPLGTSLYPKDIARLYEVLEVIESLKERE